jgi:vacuolar-type H+-ATPase subunit H
MQEIVNKVLEAEQQAEKIVQEARAEAAEIRRKADEDSERTIQEARAKAQALLQERLAEARTQSAREQQGAREEAQRENERYLRERAPDMEEAAGAVVSRLVASPLTGAKQDRKRSGPSGGGSSGT